MPARKPVTDTSLPDDGPNYAAMETPIKTDQDVRSDTAIWAQLTRPFDPDHIERLPKPLRRDDDRKGRCDGTDPWVTADGHHCGGWHSRAIHLDYIGHAGITTRLNDVLGPGGWDFQPYAHTPEGTPGMGSVFWAKLTIMGVTKWDCAANFTGPQEAYGDALRRCAMRFGIGTYLWSKSEYATAVGQDPGSKTSEAVHRAVEADRLPVAPPSPPPLDDDLVDKGTYDLLLIVDDYAIKAGKTFAEFTANWRAGFVPPLTVDDLDDLPPETVARAIMQIRARA